jgi:hypothetical protein
VGRQQSHKDREIGELGDMGEVTEMACTHEWTRGDSIAAASFPPWNMLPLLMVIGRRRAPTCSPDFRNRNRPVPVFLFSFSAMHAGGRPEPECK